MREKGKTLNDSGGMVMTTDMWMTPNAPSTKDLVDFDMRYAQKLYGPMVVGASAQDMAMAMAMYPQMKPALDKMRAEGGKMSTARAILTDTRMEAVPPGTANSTAGGAGRRGAGAEEGSWRHARRIEEDGGEGGEEASRRASRNAPSS